MRFHLIVAATAAIALGNEFADNAAESALFDDTVGGNKDCNSYNEYTFATYNYPDLCIGEECYSNYMCNSDNCYH